LFFARSVITRAGPTGWVGGFEGRGDTG